MQNTIKRRFKFSSKYTKGKQNPHYFPTLEITMDHFKLQSGNNVSDWKSMWPTLSSQNNAVLGVTMGKLCWVSLFVLT